MLSPLIARLATRPGLLVEHGSAYAQLAALEAAQLGRRWRWRALLWAVVVAGIGFSLLLGGVSALLLGALPLAAMPRPGWLLAVPAAPLALAAGVALRALGRTPAAFPHLREQLRADARVLREAAP